MAQGTGVWATCGGARLSHSLLSPGEYSWLAAIRSRSGQKRSPLNLAGPRQGPNVTHDLHILLCLQQY